MFATTKSFILSLSEWKESKHFAYQMRMTHRRLLLLFIPIVTRNMYAGMCLKPSYIKTIGN